MYNPVLDPSLPLQLLSAQLPFGLKAYHLVTIGGITLVSALISVIFRVSVLKKYTRQNHGIPPKKAIKQSKNFSYIVFLFVFVMLILPLHSFTFSIGKSIVGGATASESKMTQKLKDADKTGNYEQTVNDGVHVDVGGFAN